MADKDLLGRAGEDRAARHLEARGYVLLDRNWRGPDGELDLVVATSDHLVVVEVKTRTGDRFGHPFEAIDERKRRRLRRLTMAWVAGHPEQVQGRRIRIDAIGVIGPDPATAQLEHVSDVA